ncbi:MAG: alpha/beta hydrolase [Desulfuromonadales bacterium]|nr:alpha/beta hydrolase [Desulfuromonadales bacterium]
MKATLNDVIIRYEDAGSGPAMLVLHDGSSSREISSLFAPLVQAGYRVIVTHLDDLGKRTAEFDLATSSRQATSLLNFLGIGRAVVFGIGLGGIVLLDLLDRCPERIAASSLVLGAATARQLRQLASSPVINAALHEGRFRELKEELLSVLPAAGKEKTAQSSLPELRGWIDSVRSRDLYLSTIQHRSALLADISIPPLIVEAEEGESGSRPRRKVSLAAVKGWQKIRGLNSHLAALMGFLLPDDAEEEEEAFTHR